MLSNLSGKAGELGFTAGITYSKAAVDYYQKQIGDGNDESTQLNNDAILNKDNQKFFDQLNSEPNSFENYTTTNMAVAFSEKINTALKGNNPNEAKKLLEIFSKYMNLQYNQYQKEDAKSLLAVPNVNIDAMAQKAKLPTFLNGNQLSQLFSMFPKGSKEYNEVQKLAGMQQEIYKKVDMDLYRGYYNGNDKDKWLYPGDKNYGMLPDYYKNLGLNANSAQTIKVNESRGANAIIGSAISPLGALGSSTRLLGVDDKTADNLAIGGALIGTVVGSGVAIKTGGLNDTPLGKNEVIQSPKLGVNTTNSFEGRTNIAYTEKSIFNKYPNYTELKFNSLNEQAKFLSNSIEGLSVAQAKIILETGVNRNTSIVIGGSRVRGDNSSTSDIDIGFGSLNANQAGKARDQIQKKSNQLDSSLALEKTKIAPGNSTETIPKIKSPEEFFQRYGIRSGGDIKSGQMYIPSGAISVYPDGRIYIIPPNQKGSVSFYPLANYKEQ